MAVLRRAGLSRLLLRTEQQGDARGPWFEGARLNYAEAVLVGAPEDRPALIAVAEVLGYATTCGMPKDRAIDVMLAIVVMGRITPSKGQHLAARLAHDCGFDLVLAGSVGPYRRARAHRVAGEVARRSRGADPSGRADPPARMP
jgi:hypothetical protein